MRVYRELRRIEVAETSPAKGRSAAFYTPPPTATTVPDLFSPLKVSPKKRPAYAYTPKAKATTYFPTPQEVTQVIGPKGVEDYVLFKHFKGRYGPSKDSIALF